MISLKEAQLIRKQMTPQLRKLVEADPEHPWATIKEAARILGKDTSTIFRWLKDDTRTLGRPTGTTKLQFDDTLTSLYLGCGNNAALFLDRAKDANLLTEDPPSIWTVRRQVTKQIPRAERILSRYGDRGLREMALGYLPMVTPYRANTYLIDHCELPLYVIPPQPMRNPIKPWFTGVMDSHTRALLGFVISIQPNSTTIALAVAAAVAPDEGSPFEGIPENLIVDSGSDFLSMHIGQAMVEIGTVLSPHLGYHPNLKGPIERFHGTLRTRLQGTPGYAHGPKTLDKKRQFSRDEGWLHFNDVYGVIQNIVNWWNTHEHPELGCSPREAWERDSTLLRTVASREVLAPMLMKSTPRKVDKNGVSMWGKHFTCPEIAARKGDTVELRYWPHDQNEIYIFDNGSYLATARDVLDMSDEERAEFWQDRTRQEREAKRRVRGLKRKYRMDFAPVTQAGSTPKLAAVGPRNELPASAQPAPSSAVSLLAYGELDQTFPTEE